MTDGHTHSARDPKLSKEEDQGDELSDERQWTHSSARSVSQRLIVVLVQKHGVKTRTDVTDVDQSDDCADDASIVFVLQHEISLVEEVVVIKAPWVGPVWTGSVDFLLRFACSDFGH